MSYAIKAQELGKCYDLGRNAVRHDTLMDSLDHWLRPWKREKTAPSSGEFWALRGMTFEVEPGTSVGIIGRNGAGKSTLLKILSRITEPTTGEVRLRGRVASLLEVGTGFHGELSGRENVYLNGAILGMKRRETARRFEQIVEYAGVQQFIDVPVKRYSSGMYMRLAFAVAAFLESEILIVDEVLAVGDAAFQNKCLSTMQDAAAGGRTVLFVSHNMAAVNSLTTRTLLLDNGSIVFDGPSSEATQHYVGRRQHDHTQARRPVAQIDSGRHWRRDDRLMITEMGLAADQAQTIHHGDAVRMEVLIRAEGAHERLRLAYSINSAAGQPLMTGLTEFFSVEPGEHLFELCIEDIALVPGEYDFSMALGTGSFGEFRLERDSYIGFGRLTVSEALRDGGHVANWPAGWAQLLHRKSRLRRIALETAALS